MQVLWWYAWRREKWLGLGQCGICMSCSTRIPIYFAQCAWVMGTEHYWNPEKQDKDRLLSQNNGVAALSYTQLRSAHSAVKSKSNWIEVSPYLVSSAYILQNSCRSRLKSFFMHSLEECHWGRNEWFARKLRTQQASWGDTPSAESFAQRIQWSTISRTLLKSKKLLSTSSPFVRELGYYVKRTNIL